MKKYLLDTCIVVFLFRDKYNVAERMDAVGMENCYISEVTVAELQAGVEKSSSKHFNQLMLDKFTRMVNIVPFSSVIKRYAKVRFFSIRNQERGMRKSNCSNRVDELCEDRGNACIVSRE